MTNITLYTHNTPNGFKLAIYLGLLGLKYNIRDIDTHGNEQKEPWFLKLNPNGRIPTLIDNSSGITISESAAIMTYLANTYDKERKFSYEPGTKEYYRELELTFFQMAGVGPMQGQAIHFTHVNYIPYAKKRYIDETRRLYGVLEEQLRRNGGKYLVGDHISIADVANIGWAVVLPFVEIQFTEFPRVHQWIKDLYAIPAVRKGFTIPLPNPIVPTEF